MHPTFMYFAVMILFVALLARLTIWSRRDSWVRHTILAAYILFMPAAALVAADSLGWNRPIHTAWRIHGDFAVLGVKMEKDVGIYLYLDTGYSEPRPVKLPWDSKQADEIQDMMDEGQPLRFKYNWSWEYRDPPMIYPAPQPQTPLPKGRPPEPERYTDA